MIVPQASEAGGFGGVIGTIFLLPQVVDVVAAGGIADGRGLPRVLRTPFVKQWNRRGDEVEQEAERLRDELLAAIRQGRGHEMVPFTGQTAGLIREVSPARPCAAWSPKQKRPCEGQTHPS